MVIQRCNTEIASEHRLQSKRNSEHFTRRMTREFPQGQNEFLRTVAFNWSSILSLYHIHTKNNTLHIVAILLLFLQLVQQTRTHGKTLVVSHLCTCAVVGPLRQSIIFHQPGQITERGDRYNRCTSYCQSLPFAETPGKEKIARICENQNQSHVSHVMRVLKMSNQKAHH